MMHIEKETYKISTNNYIKSKYSKTQIVIGVSLRKGHNHITRLQHKEYGKTKKWNTYTIGRDGTIYQHYDDKYYTNFIGIKEGDKHNVSIVLENMGALYSIDDETRINWINEICEEENVIKKGWMGYNYWEKFPIKQLKSLTLLCNDICDNHDIPKKIIEFNHYHKDIYKFKGIVFRGNYIDDSSDMNPLLEITKLNEMLLL